MLLLSWLILIVITFAASQKDTTAEQCAVPILSLNELSKDNGSHLMDALENIGCFYLKDHGISQQTIDRAMNGLKTFFAYSKELKSQITIDKNQRGWLDSTPTKSGVTAKMKYTNVTDYKEVLFFGPNLDPNDPDINNKPMVALNQWPTSFMPELSDDIDPYYNELMRVGATILESIAIGLGLNDTHFFKKYYVKPLGRGQLLYYPPPIDRERDIYGVGPHSDLGIITILLQDDNGGLQFYSRKYKEWIDVSPIESTLIINIGDLLEKWTAFKLKSTIHRVLNGDRKRNRYGIAFFYDPSSDALIDPHDVISDDEGEDGELQFVEPFYAGKYIDDWNRKLFAHYKDQRYDQSRESVENELNRDSKL
eukprot:267553_1